MPISRIVAAAATSLLFLAALAGASVPSVGAAGAELVPVIVTLADGVDPADTASEHSGATGEVARVFEHALNGYAASLPASIVDSLLEDARVERVELDGVMSLSAMQASPTWGLDRIDQRQLPLDDSFSYTSAGSGVDIYVIDTGINPDHADFTGRIGQGRDVYDGDDDPTDCNGHGTHVSGTAMGTTYGVAKDATVIPVKAFGCGVSTSTSTLIAGIDWVTAHHDETGPTAVANMSFGGSASSSLDSAVRNMIADGVAAAIAAGNGNLLGMPQDACNVSPARVSEALTVGATDRDDDKASFTNDGPCVDFYAPGVSITSAAYDSVTGTDTLSGTSMAAPHAAGVAALYLAATPGATAADAHDALNAAESTVSSTTSTLLLFRSSTTIELLYTSW